jgi:hypothetical protein
MIIKLQDSPVPFQILVSDVLLFRTVVYWLNYVAAPPALSSGEQDVSRHAVTAKLLDPCLCPLVLLQQASVVLPEDEPAVAVLVFHRAETHLKTFMPIHEKFTYTVFL